MNICCLDGVVNPLVFCPGRFNKSFPVTHRDYV